MLAREAVEEKLLPLMTRDVSNTIIDFDPPLQKVIFLFLPLYWLTK
jgi:hypothetical protein